MTQRRTLLLTTALLGVGLAVGAVLYARAQTVRTPALAAAVCAYSSSPPTVSTGNFVYVQCNSSGELLLH
jgi:hypothetical protein